MKLRDYQFPTIKDVDLSFSTVKTSGLLLGMAKEGGFYNGKTPANDLFNTIFYKGGRVAFKKDNDPAFQDKAWRYLQALMNSFEPKHEEKEAVAALILNELCEL